MPILIQANNTTAVAQRVQLRDAAQVNNLADVNIAANTNVNLYTLAANASITLYLVCNVNNAEAARLNIVYPGNSSVEQDSDWVRQWHVEGTGEAGTGVQMTLR